MYIIVSLLDRKEPFNLEKMLHRGKYAIKEDRPGADKPDLEEARGLKALIGGKEFTTTDKAIRLSVLVWGIGWLSVFVVGIICNKLMDIPEHWWSKFWHIYIWISMVMGAIVTVWFLIGGLKDLRYMFKTLATAKRDEMDDGMVLGHQNRGQIEDEISNSE